MIIQSPGEVAFYIFNFPVYWYGIVLAFAAFCGVCVAEFLARRFSDIPEDFFIDVAPLVIIFGIIGARVYYCLVNFHYYSSHVAEVIDIRQGGLSIHGMIIAGVVAFYFIARKYKLNLLKVLDVLACATIFAQSIGRWGNFFNSEAFGIPTYSDWGVFIPIDNRPFQYISYEFFHPTFLYESLVDLLIFFVLLFILSKCKKSGVVFFWYLILYSIARIFVEFIRVDSVLNIASLPIAVIVSCILLFIGIFGVYAVSRRYHSEN